MWISLLCLQNIAAGLWLVKTANSLFSLVSTRCLWGPQWSDDDDDSQTWHLDGLQTPDGPRHCRGQAEDSRPLSTRATRPHCGPRPEAQNRFLTAAGCRRSWASWRTPRCRCPRCPRGSRPPPCRAPSCASSGWRGGCRTCRSPAPCSCKACQRCARVSASYGRWSWQTSDHTHQTRTWKVSHLKKHKKQSAKV